MERGNSRILISALVTWAVDPLLDRTDSEKVALAGLQGSYFIKNEIAEYICSKYCLLKLPITRFWNLLATFK